MRRQRARWAEIVIAVGIVVALYFMFGGWQDCDGTYVRTLFWFKCIP